MIAFAFFLGALGWTFAEYMIHRFDGHGMRGRTPFSREHLAHHRDPRTFAATWKKAVVAGSVIGLMGPLAGWFLGAAGWGFTFGFTAMYITYEWLHRRIHTHAPIGPYGRWTRRHHLLHHHLDPEMNHGVTSPLWDVVFRTYVTAPVVLVPRHRVPVWLKDARGAVPARYADSFQIRGA